MDAEQALREVRARQEQTIRAAFAPLPWWALAGRFLILTAIGVAGDLDPSAMSLGYPFIILVGVGATEVLRVLTDRRLGVKLHWGRRPAAVVMVDIAEMAVLMGMLVLTVVLLPGDVPLHGTLAGMLVGAAAAAIAPLVQRLRFRMLRHR